MSLYEPHRQLDIVAQLCLIAIGILFLFSLYLILRSLFTKSRNLGVAPVHVQSAPSLLKWVTKVALLLAILAVCFDVYDQLWSIGLKGSFEAYHFAMILMSDLVLIGIGTGCALLAMTGVALIRVKETRFRKRPDSRTKIPD